MVPFNANAVCVKCGSDDINSVYYATNEHHSWESCRYKQEHIHRDCRRCKFSWNEAPLNIPVEARP